MSRRIRRTRRVWILFVVAALGVLLPTGQAAAQMGDFRDEMQHAQTVFERTEEILEKVAAEVREADVPKARDLLGAAVQLQMRAHQLFNGLSADGPLLTSRARLRQSVTLSLKARDTALQAGKILREQVTLQRRAQRVLEQAADRFTRMREHAAEGADSTLRDLMRRVQSQLERAQRQYRDGNFEVALRLGQTSLELMQSAASRDDGPALVQRYERMLEQTRNFYERALGSDGLDEAQRQRLERVGDLLQRSEQQARAGHPRMAVELLERARGLLGGMDRQGRDAEEIRQAIERVDRALGELGEQLEGAPGNVQRMLDKAGEEHRRSLRALGAGDLDRALRHHRAAVDLLTRLRNWVDDQSR